MKPVAFVDTGYWIALTSESDRLHAKAIALARIPVARKLVTTEMVLTEFLDGAANHGEYRRRAAVMASGTVSCSRNRR